MPDAISVEGLTVRFPDGTLAIDDVSLRVAEGEIVAIVGPSGCGKSTLLRVLSSLLRPSSGELQVDRSRLAYVFQDPTLLPWLDAVSNVEIPLRLAGVGRAERRRRALEVLDEVGLADSAHKLPRALSGGMRMRVSVARSLVTRPSVFLLDEPFGAVDEMTRENLGDLVLDLHEGSHFAAVFVTHSVAEAVYLADRVLVMSPRPGRIARSFDVDLPRPRGTDERWSSRFSELAARVSASLRSDASR